MARKLKLLIRKLSTMLDLEGAGGTTVPYLGFVEVKLAVPEVSAFEQDVLALVIPDTTYNRQVPFTIGTLRINMILNAATATELERLSIVWQ